MCVNVLVFLTELQLLLQKFDVRVKRDRYLYNRLSPGRCVIIIVTKPIE